MQKLIGTEIIKQLNQSNIEYVLSVPDITTSENILKPLINNNDIKVIQVCKEDEAISISAGLYAAGKKSVILIQHTGLLDSINCLRAVSVEIGNPTFLLVGLLRHESGTDPNDSNRYGLKIIKPILEAMNIEYSYIDKSGDEKNMTNLINKSFDACKPHIVLIGSEPQ
jgi:sulfopyruvate decarboxylase TPP-binding subunit